ncbi:hypothetical protein D3C76_1000790 [compost metagenome]
MAESPARCQRFVAGGQCTSQSGRASAPRRQHRSGPRADPPAAATSPGDLSHPGQRPAADRTGSYPQPMDRQRIGADPARRPRPRRTVRRHRPDPHRRLVLQPVPGAPDADGRPRRLDQGDQAATAGHPRQRPGLLPVALPGRCSGASDAGHVAASAGDLQLPRPVRPELRRGRAVHACTRIQRRRAIGGCTVAELAVGGRPGLWR